MTTADRAELEFEEGVRLANKFDFWGFYREYQQEEAAEMFSRSAARFKASRNYRRAGDAYEQSAMANLAAGSELSAIEPFKEAAKSYRRVDVDKAHQCYQQLAALYLNTSKFQSAARTHIEIGEMFEEHGRVEEAILQHDQAIDLYEIEHADSLAAKQRVVIAHLCARVDQFERAIELFERSTADVLASGTAMRFNARKYLFKALLCHVCVAERTDDLGAIQDALDRYQGMTDVFMQSREGQFCAQMVQCIVDCDEDGYRRAHLDLQAVGAIGEWETDLIRRGQEYIHKNQYPEPDLQGVDSVTARSELPAVVGRQMDPFEAPVVDDDAPEL